MVEEFRGSEPEGQTLNMYSVLRYSQLKISEYTSISLIFGTFSLDFGDNKWIFRNNEFSGWKYMETIKKIVNVSSLNLKLDSSGCKPQNYTPTLTFSLEVCQKDFTERVDHFLWMLVSDGTVLRAAD